ncbi:MAG TPA: DUF433 domain-containing protein [Longimicrobium sp.]|jgi:uncharacterized protein (DUF433 family)|uniref:DUF433 domain-containing protein n=1 Tax=Longimicrobium sp. TaxID=2029185 RepID=UPI002ED9CE6F
MEKHAGIGEGSMVMIDPQVCGGMPVVRGTRIAVHTLADLAGQGAPHEELLEDYPSLTAESLSAALEYARANPRRNQPAPTPWVGGTVVSTRSLEHG